MRAQVENSSTRPKKTAAEPTSLANPDRGCRSTPIRSTHDLDACVQQLDNQQDRELGR